MPFLQNLFGTKKPTSAAARQALAEHELKLASAPARIAAADAALARVADMTADQHAAAEAERDEARRAAVRLEAQVVDLRTTVAAAERFERIADLRARHEAAQKRMATMPKALDALDRCAAATAEAAAEVDAIDAQVAAINFEIAEARKAGLDVAAPIPTSAEVFCTEPDVVEPDQTIEEEVWEIPQAGGGWGSSGVFVERNGEMVPEQAGSRRRKVKRVIPGRTTPGRRMASPTAGLCLPAARIGRAPHWPRSA